jgi:hypothetical protein
MASSHEHCKQLLSLMESGVYGEHTCTLEDSKCSFLSETNRSMTNLVQAYLNAGHGNWYQHFDKTILTNRLAEKSHYASK